MSNRLRVHTDDANQAAVRGRFYRLLASCSLAASVTTLIYSTTVSQALRQSLRSRRSRANLVEFIFHALR